MIDDDPAWSSMIRATVFQEHPRFSMRFSMCCTGLAFEDDPLVGCWFSCSGWRWQQFFGLENTRNSQSRSDNAGIKHWTFFSFSSIMFLSKAPFSSGICQLAIFDCRRVTVVTALCPLGWSHKVATQHLIVTIRNVYTVIIINIYIYIYTSNTYVYTPYVNMCDIYIHVKGLYKLLWDDLTRS